MKEDSLTVDVKVGPELRSWIIATAGTDILVPERETNLWCLVKQHLQTVPASYRIIYDRGDYVYLRLLNSSSHTKAWNLDAGRTIKVDTLYRSYLDENGQYVVRRFLYRNFKAAFRNYMMGAVRSNPGGREIAAITEFCLEYNIDVTKPLLARLQKDWIRHKKKVEAGLYNPMVF